MLANSQEALSEFVMLPSYARYNNLPKTWVRDNDMFCSHPQ